MTPDELTELRKEAVIAAGEHGTIGNVARALIAIIDNPSLVVPATHVIVPRPQLLGLGVPQR